jgi:hypothetical protein
MKTTYCTPASAHRGEVVSMTLQGKTMHFAEVTSSGLGSPAAGSGLSFGL